MGPPPLPADAAPGGGGSGGGSTGRAAPSAALLWLLLKPPPGQLLVKSKSSVDSKRRALCWWHRELRVTRVCRRRHRRSVAAAARWSSHCVPMHTLPTCMLPSGINGREREHGGTRAAEGRANRRGRQVLLPPLGARERRPAATTPAGQAGFPGLSHDVGKHPSRFWKHPRRAGTAS